MKHSESLRLCAAAITTLIACSLILVQACGDSVECAEEHAYVSLLSRSGSAGRAIRVSLDALCRGNCASPSVDETGGCIIRVEGCGLVAVGRPNIGGGTIVVYRDGEVVGRGVSDDVGSEIGGCQGSAFQAGEWPPFPPEWLPEDEEGTSPPEGALCEEATVERTGC